MTPMQPLLWESTMSTATSHRSSQQSSKSRLLREDDFVGNEKLQETVRERQGDSLWRTLYERHVNMIAFTGTVGTGLFLGSGTQLAFAGPGGSVLAYVLIGSVMSSVISCLCEMAALMPVNGPMLEFPRRFLDRGVGFAMGWIYWFAYTVLAAHQVVQVTSCIRFHYDDGRTYLSWSTGEKVNPAVWISMTLVVVVLVNMIKVRHFGELEYVVGCIKMIFLVLLIIMMITLDTMKPTSSAYYTEKLGTKYWDSPYTFFNSEYRVITSDGELQHVITGTSGRLLGMWRGCVTAVFSFTGMDMVAATAAESRALTDPECMKMAARKITLRIILLYSLVLLTVSFVVPYNHPFLNGGGQSAGARSPFVIAVVEAGLPAAAHFFNAMFLFSSLTCSFDNAYVATRVLHTLALRGETGPEFITRRLRRCHSGVPTRSVFTTAAIMLIAYMGSSGASYARLGELASNCTVSFLIVYACICGTYMCFYRTLQDAKDSGNISETQAALYDRDNPRYPYRSHGQWLRACYGMIACTVLLVLNGFDVFLTKPLNTRSFVASYISLPVFVLLILVYKVWKHGFQISQWFPERSNDLRNCIQARSDARKGRLEFPDEGFTLENCRVFLDWVWTWMK